jgi:hypothetical protein
VRQGRFHHPPLLIGSQLALSDDRWALAVEAAIGRQLSQWVVDNMSDATTIKASEQARMLACKCNVHGTARHQPACQAAPAVSAGLRWPGVLHCGPASQPAEAAAAWKSKSWPSGTPPHTQHRSHMSAFLADVRLIWPTAFAFVCVCVCIAGPVLKAAAATAGLQRCGDVVFSPAAPHPARPTAATGGDDLPACASLPEGGERAGGAKRVDRPREYRAHGGSAAACWGRV